MKPPVCEICGKDFRSEHFHTRGGGRQVRRSDGRFIWACSVHSDAEAADAPLLLPGGPLGLIGDPELWVTSVGPNEHLVFSVLREAAGLSPAEAKAVVRRGAFKVCTGWPMYLEPWRVRLEAAGATTELRYP